MQTPHVAVRYSEPMETYTRFSDIPSFTQMSQYAVDYAWSHLGTWLEDMQSRGLQLNPDFQRGHVWAPEQQVSYVEFILRGGRSSRDILFNFPGYSYGLDADVSDPNVGEFVCVDGLQRLTAAMAFMNNEIPAFGSFLRDYKGKPDFGVSFRLHVNNLPTREAVLTWYLELNSAGTPHTEIEIERVRALLVAEKTRRDAEPYQIATEAPRTR